MFSQMQIRLEETTAEMLEQASKKIVEIVPQIVLAFGVLFAGLLVAHIACRVVHHVFDFLGLDKLANKVNVDKMLRSVGIHRSVSSIFCFLIYWLILFATLMLISEVLALGTASEAIGAIVGYIPHLIAGLLILVVGLLLGRFFRDVISTPLARAGIASSIVLGTIVQVLIVLFAALLALKQVGFDVSVITTNIAVILGVVLVTVGLAVALAIRPVLENAFLCKQVCQHIRRGDIIEVEGVKGEVVDVSLTSVVIRHGHHDEVIPARKLFEQRFTRTRS